MTAFIEVLFICFVIAVLCACAPSAVTYRYSWGTITRLDPVALERKCADGNTLTADDGTIYHGRWTPIVGCYDTDDASIFIQDSCEGAKALPHELAHDDGHEDPEKDGYGW